MFGILKLMYPAPISEPISSRDSNAYLLETLRFSGLNLRNDFGVGLKIWRVLSFTYNMLILPVSFPVNYTIHLAEFPPDLLLQSLQLCLNTWCFSLKFFTLVIYMPRLELANKHFDQMDEFCVKSEEKRKVRDMVAAITRLYLIFVVVYVLYATSTLLDGLLHERVPFNTYYPLVNWRVDRTQLYVQSFLEYFTIGYAIVVATATDSYPVIYVAALRTHILLLKDRIVHLGEANNESSSDPDSMLRSLVDCIKAHRTMLKSVHPVWHHHLRDGRPSADVSALLLLQRHRGRLQRGGRRIVPLRVVDAGPAVPADGPPVSAEAPTADDVHGDEYIQH
ncbi:odorant receptor 43b isoform X2 [Drosophila gunungcola]|uniref:odorant receptor 43b isoform X2 n=1 Tax=Drosophila gunungcola TaxID=103775 RepID=UPI0022E3F092|nr:odorant receptor 43b isoform X2 [Drosophila gunungcola]